MDKVINQHYIDKLKVMIEIRQFVKTENIEKREVSIEQVKDKWSDFSEKYSHLVNLCVGKEMDFNKMVYLFRLKTLVEEGKISDYDASVVHGKMVYDSYVKQ